MNERGEEVYFKKKKKKKEKKKESSREQIAPFMNENYSSNGGSNEI